MGKEVPRFQTDEEAEAFVASADLSEYDLTDMVPVRFELREKDGAGFERGRFESGGRLEGD